jgi:hypothetical protein
MIIPRKGSHTEPIVLDESYFTLTLEPSGRLRMTMSNDQPDQEFLAHCVEIGEKQGYDLAESEFMEPFTEATGWLFSNAEYFMYLSSAPMLVPSGCWDLHENSQQEQWPPVYDLLPPYVYWYDHDYAACSFLDDLNEQGYHVWERNPHADEHSG